MPRFRASKTGPATWLSRRADFTIEEHDGVCYLTRRNPGDGWTRSGEAGLSFRRIADADLAFLARVHASSRADEFAVAPWPEARKAAFVNMQFNLQHVHVQKKYPRADRLVIVRGGEDAGRLYIERRPGQHHHIIDLALLPEHRGKGAGCALLRDLMDEAASCGKAVTIHLEKHNPATRLFRRLGFRTAEDNGLYDLWCWRG